MQVAVQKEVQFYDDRLTAVRADDDAIYVSITEVCGVLGLGAAAQRRRIEEHDVLGEGLARLTIETAGGPQSVYMLRHDLVPLWLAGVQGRAVREDVRPKLKQFQLRAAALLYEAFQEERLTADPAFDDLLRADSPAAQAYRMAQAMLQLARQQLLLEARLADAGARLDAHDVRLEQIESALGDRGRFITPEQASEISQAVKSIATALHKKSGRNEYGAIYGEFYRKFGIPSYRELPARRFDEAMRFLADWFAEVTGQTGLPF